MKRSVLVLIVTAILTLPAAVFAGSQISQVRDAVREWIWSDEVRPLQTAGHGVSGARAAVDLMAAVPDSTGEASPPTGRGRSDHPADLDVRDVASNPAHIRGDLEPLD